MGQHDSYKTAYLTCTDLVECGEFAVVQVQRWCTSPNSESGIEKQVYHKNIQKEELEGEDDETCTTTSCSRFLLNMASGGPPYSYDACP